MGTTLQLQADPPQQSARNANPPKYNTVHAIIVGIGRWCILCALSHEKITPVHREKLII